eukprot:scaffold111695_cov32-Tisochrysis_lutea.AAC.1
MHVLETWLDVNTDICVPGLQKPAKRTKRQPSANAAVASPNECSNWLVTLLRWRLAVRVEHSIGGEDATQETGRIAERGIKRDACALRLSNQGDPAEPGLSKQRCLPVNRLMDLCSAPAQMVQIDLLLQVGPTLDTPVICEVIVPGVLSRPPRKARDGPLRSAEKDEPRPLQ